MTPDDSGAPSPMFYSQAAQIAGQLAPKASPQQYRAALLNKGVKPDEIKHSGFDETFAGRDKLGRDELVGHFQRTLPALQETVLRSKNPYPHKTAAQWQGAIDAAERAGNWDEQARLTNAWEAHEGKGGAGATKFHSYTLPGGQNYREVLLHLPVAKEAAFDPSKVRVERRQQSTTQGDVTLHYGDKKIGTFSDNIQINPATGRWEGLPDSHWLSVMERRFGGSPEMRIKPMDEGQTYRSSHWDQPNVVAHLRLSDRDKGKTLHVEELQSDWAQEGRKKGFKQPVTQAEIEEGARLLGDMGPNTTPEEHARYADIARRAHGVPHAPYVDSTAKWTDLALKRVLYEAAKGGYQRVVITPGEEQAKRYDLSKHLTKLKAIRSIGGGNTYTLDAVLKGRDEPTRIGENIPEKDLDDHVGKEMAAKIIKDIDVAQNNRWGVKNRVSGTWSPRFGSREEAAKYQEGLPASIKAKTDILEMTPKYATEYSGLDLHVGGEGMKGYYDKIVPAALHKLAKRHDPEAKITRRTLGAADTPLHNLEITPKMRESILRGQAAYASGGKVSDARQDKGLITKAIHTHDRQMHGDGKLTDLRGLASGGVVDKALNLVGRQAHVQT